MIQNLQKKTLCIHKFPKGKATELPIGAQIRGGDSLTPQVKRMPLHYAKSLFFSALACVHPSFNSNPSPPCNNLCMLCIKSSVPGSDWNKMDITRGARFVKYIATNYLQGSLPPKKHLRGEESEFLLGRIRLLWDVMDRYKAEIYGSVHPRGYIKEEMEGRKERETTAKGRETGNKLEELEGWKKG